MQLMTLLEVLNYAVAVALRAGLPKHIHGCYYTLTEAPTSSAAATNTAAAAAVASTAAAAEVLGYASAGAARHSTLSMLSVWFVKPFSCM
jgi:hypothetical protein